jgi:hypothetical protein
VARPARRLRAGHLECVCRRSASLFSFVLSYFVIASASEAIQLLYRAALDCFVAFTPRNDDRNRWLFDIAACTIRAHSRRENALDCALRFGAEA